VQQVKWDNHIYVLASGDGEYLDIFKVDHVKNSKIMGKIFAVSFE
jgi:hypothetical protein